MSVLIIGLLLIRSLALVLAVVNLSDSGAFSAMVGFWRT